MHATAPSRLCLYTVCCLLRSLICSWQFDSFLCLSLWLTVFLLFLSLTSSLNTCPYGMPAAFYLSEIDTHILLLSMHSNRLLINSFLYLPCKNTEKMIRRSYHSCLYKRHIPFCNHNFIFKSCFINSNYWPFCLFSSHCFKIY